LTGAAVERQKKKGRREKEVQKQIKQMKGKPGVKVSRFKGGLKGWTHPKPKKKKTCKAYKRGVRPGFPDPKKKKHTGNVGRGAMVGEKNAPSLVGDNRQTKGHATEKVQFCQRGKKRGWGKKTIFDAPGGLTWERVFLVSRTFPKEALNTDQHKVFEILGEGGGRERGKKF